MQGHPVPTEDLTRERHFAVRFVRTRVSPVRQKGKFRGDGELTIDVGAVRIKGKRVPSTGVRWILGLSIYVVLVTLGAIFISVPDPAGTPYQTGLGILIGILSYVAANFWISFKEQLTIQFSDILEIAEDQSENLIVVSFSDPALSSPIVFQTPDWRAIAALLGEKKVERTPA